MKYKELYDEIKIIRINDDIEQKLIEILKLVLKKLGLDAAIFCFNYKNLNSINFYTTQDNNVILDSFYEPALALWADNDYYSSQLVNFKFSYLIEINEIPYAKIEFLSSSEFEEENIETVLKNIFNLNKYPELLLELKHNIEKKYLLENYFQTILAIANAMDALGPYTYGHSKRVAIFCTDIARALQMSAYDICKLKFAAILHDLGKLNLTNDILSKKEMLSLEDFNTIRIHPVYSYLILKDIDFLKEILPIIKFHHERYDGKGYPEKKLKDEIPLGAKIMAIADTYDALTSSRPYKKGLPKDLAIEELKKCAGFQFDPELVRIFIKILFDKNTLSSQIAKKMVVFTYKNPEAKEVYLAGDFNLWQSHTHKMHKGKQGIFSTEIELSTGKYEYRFLVDGKPQYDKKAKENLKASDGNINSVIYIK